MKVFFANYFKALTLSMAALLFSASNMNAQFNTPTVNGTIAAGEYGTHTNGVNQQVSANPSNNATWYMTWDNTNLYIGIGSADNNSSESAVVYLDIDPIAVVSGGANANGSTAGYGNYDRCTYNPTIRADMVIYFKNGYYEYRTRNAGGWSSQTTTGLTYAQSGNGANHSQEIAIPWNLTPAGSRPAAFNWLAHKVYNNGWGNNGMYGAVPSGNPNGVKNVGDVFNQGATYTETASRYFTVSSTADGSATPPFSRVSYAKNSGTDDIKTGPFWDLTVSGGTAQINDPITVNNKIRVASGGILRGCNSCGGSERTLTMSSTATDIDATGGKIQGTESNSNVNLVIAGTTTYTGDAAAILDRVFQSITVNAASTLILTSPIFCKYTAFTCNGTLQLNSNNLIETTDGNAKKPTYNATTGFLVYNTGTAHNTAGEWSETTAIGNVTVKNNSTVTLAGSRNVAGALNLESGSLAVGTGNTLTFSGSSPIRTSGTLDVSNATATVAFTNTAAITLPSSIFSGNVRNLTVNGAGGVTIGSPTTVAGILTLTSGSVSLGANDLTVNGTFSGAVSGSGSQIITNGTGKLTQNVGTTEVSFPVATGSGATNYALVKIQQASGSASYSVRVDNTTANRPDIEKTAKLTWDITSATGSGATIQFQWDDAKNGTGFATSAGLAATVGHWNGASWDVVSTTISKGSSTNIVGAGPFSSFSPFAVAGVTALSVEFLDIRAQQKATATQISWTTANESEVAYYDIERSETNYDFLSIGQVKANKNSVAKNNYSFTDDNARAAINYYRIKSVNTDGKATYSKVVSVSNGSKGGRLALSPNPVANELRVSTAADRDGEMSFQVVDMLGRTIINEKRNVTKGDNQLTINMSQLVNGTYLLQVNGETMRFQKH